MNLVEESGRPVRTLDWFQDDRFTLVLFQELVEAERRTQGGRGARRQGDENAQIEAGCTTHVRHTYPILATADQDCDGSFLDQTTQITLISVTKSPRASWAGHCYQWFRKGQPGFWAAPGERFPPLAQPSVPALQGLGRRHGQDPGDPMRHATGRPADDSRCPRFLRDDLYRRPGHRTRHHSVLT